MRPKRGWKLQSSYMIVALGRIIKARIRLWIDAGCIKWLRRGTVGAYRLVGPWQVAKILDLAGRKLYRLALIPLVGIKRHISPANRNAGDNWLGCVRVAVRALVASGVRNDAIFGQVDIVAQTELVGLGVQRNIKHIGGPGQEKGLNRSGDATKKTRRTGPTWKSRNPIGLENFDCVGAAVL